MKISKSTGFIMLILGGATLALTLTAAGTSSNVGNGRALGQIFCAVLAAVLIGYLIYVISGKSSRAANRTIVVVFALGIAFIIAQDLALISHSPLNQLKQMVVTSNKELPKNVDKYTALKGITFDVGKKLLVYHFEIIDPKFTFAPNANETVRMSGAKAIAGDVVLSDLLEKTESFVDWSYSRGEEVLLTVHVR
jgi:ABC-type transport system involved in multi-copper enzyme maturation permease subunit